MNQLNNISPSFNGTKKTMMGNEYKTSSKNTKLGGLAGLVAGSGIAYMNMQKFKGEKLSLTYSPEKYADKPAIRNFMENVVKLKPGDKLKYRSTKNRRNFVNQLHEMDLSLNKFGSSKERKAVTAGFLAINGAIALAGMFVGAMVGKCFDSRNNRINAKIADEQAQSSK